MEAIVSLLDAPTDLKVKALWDQLAERCGLQKVKISPIPHFTWQGAEAYEQAEVDDSLHKLANTCKPFTVRVAGMGLFNGPEPVLYLPLVKTRKLFSLHEKIWKRIANYSTAASRYYSPSMWIPHITLAYHDINPANIDCAMEVVAFQKFDWEINIDNFAMIYQNADGTGRVRDKILFGAGGER